MKFGTLIDTVLCPSGDQPHRKVCRSVWPKAVFVQMVSVDANSEDILMIFREDDQQMHPFTLSASDLQAADWLPVITTVIPHAVSSRQSEPVVEMRPTPSQTPSAEP